MTVYLQDPRLHADDRALSTSALMGLWGFITVINTAILVTCKLNWYFRTEC